MGAERPRLGGRADPAFRRIGEVFAERLAGEELGAAVCVVVDGRTVVDLWGGFVDRRRSVPWRRDTLVCCFSATKGMAALTVLDAVAEAGLDLDAPLHTHWPELVGEGRESITLRHVLTHAAGLPGWRPATAQAFSLTADALFDTARMTRALVSQEPFWPPGTRHGYHARSFGFLLDGILQHAVGETVGERFARRFAGPREVDFHIGLPAAEHARCSALAPAPAGTRAPEGSADMLRAMNDAASATAAAFSVPPTARGTHESAAWRSASLPAMNGHGTARALAGIYGTLALDDGSLLPSSLLHAASTPQREGPDEVLLQRSCFGLGFMCSRPSLSVGLGEASFGHAGAGGSLAFADGDARVGFAFVMNRLRPGAVTGNASAMALVDALRGTLA